MSISNNEQSKPEKVVLQKTGTHVEVTAGPYTKRQLREMLLSAGDREVEFTRRYDVDEEDVRMIKDGDIFEETEKKFSDLKLKQQAEFTANDQYRKTADLESDLINLLRGKGISDDLINRILKYGLTDEMIRLLKALGLTDEEIAALLGIWEISVERQANSEESCLSVVSSSEEYMSVDGFYLMSHFRNPLSKALGDIVRKKPWNPAEYLGHWLLNYKICEERTRKQKEFDAELQAERERRRIKQVITGPNVSEVDEEEGELTEDWNFTEYETD